MALGVSGANVNVAHRPPRRPHRKSRNGCFDCKRRKIKCDESKPRCVNCTSFGLACSFVTGFASNTRETAFINRQDSNGKSLSLKRKRGRPRKYGPASPSSSPSLRSDGPIKGSDASLADTSPWKDASLTTIDLLQAELLHQFITITGPGIAAGSDDPGHAMGQFWAQNAPRIGFSNPHVLHLAYSLAGYHLARGDSWDRNAQAHRLAVAKLNFTAGLAGLNKAISVMDSGTCGAIYISVMLLCFCTFAAGPVGRNDLLVCQVGVAQPKPSVPLARGAHLVRQRFDSATLFSGLMAPLAPTNSQPADSRATCHRQCFVRVDWIDQLSRLRELIVSSDTREVSVTIRSFDTLRAIYEATYGDRDGLYEGPPMHGMVLRWLYVMEDDFVASLQSKDAMALLILAYFAPLLNTMSKAWFLKGWAEHLLTSIRIFIDKEYVEWLEWPMGVAEQYSEHIC